MTVGGEVLTIKKAKATDLEPVWAIVRRSIAAMVAAGIDQWDDRYPARTTLADDIAAGTLFILRRHAEPAGLVVLNTDQEPEYAELDWRFTGRVLVVHRLVIDPRFQRQGLATRLMRFAENHAAGAYDAIRLDAFAANPGAVAFYTRLGYRRVGSVTFRKGEFHCFEKAIARS